MSRQVDHSSWYSVYEWCSWCRRHRFLMCSAGEACCTCTSTAHGCQWHACGRCWMGPHIRCECPPCRCRQVAQHSRGGQAWQVAAYGHGTWACMQAPACESKGPAHTGRAFLCAHLPQPGSNVYEVAQRVGGVVLQCGGPRLLAIHFKRIGQAGRCQERGRLCGALQVQQRELQKEAAQAEAQPHKHACCVRTRLP